MVVVVMGIYTIQLQFGYKYPVMVCQLYRVGGGGSIHYTVTVCLQVSCNGLSIISWWWWGYTLYSLTTFKVLISIFLLLSLFTIC